MWRSTSAMREDARSLGMGALDTFTFGAVEIRLWILSPRTRMRLPAIACPRKVDVDHTHQLVTF